MTKPDSGLFKGTSSIEDFYGDAERVIAERVKGLDLTPHPITQKQLSSKQRKRIKDKIENRTATREEYKMLNWDKRLSKRRKKGVDEFWKNEKILIKSGRKGTRSWTPEQLDEIMAGEKPKNNGKTMQSHHSYSVAQFPHLANRGEVIYPATQTEHLKGWHGEKYNLSSPGKRIRRIREF